MPFMLFFSISYVEKRYARMCVLINSRDGGRGAATVAMTL